MRLEDPEVVRAEYADERRLAARKRAHAHSEGPDARDLLVAAVADARPRRVLDVGCGEGDIAERLARELGIEVVAVDQSPRMVELTRERGVDARIADVQALPFRDGEFDCAMAAWVLFHVADVDRAVAEITRVLQPGGRFVAATNGRDHMLELYRLVGREPLESTFPAERAEGILRRPFRQVERRDAHGWIVFPDTAAAQGYVDSMIVLSGKGPPQPGPIRARRTAAVFVAEK